MLILQTRWRAYAVRKQHERVIELRRLACCEFDAPIGYMAALFACGNVASILATAYASTPGTSLHWMAYAWPYMLLVLSFPVMIHSARKQAGGREASLERCVWDVMACM